VALPQAVADHHRPHASGLFFFVRQQPAAEGRSHSEHLKIIRRDRRRVNALWLPRASERRVIVVIRQEPRQALRPRAQVHVVRVRKRRRGVLAALSPHHRDKVTGARLPGNRVQHRGVDPAEDRAVGTDAQRQCEDGDGREARVLGQHAQTIPKVLQHCLHWWETWSLTAILLSCNVSFVISITNTPGARPLRVWLCKGRPFLSWFPVRGCRTLKSLPPLFP